MDANARRQIEYAKKRLRREYRGPDLTSGPLTVGKCYQLTRFAMGKSIPKRFRIRGCVRDTRSRENRRDFRSVHTCIVNADLSDFLGLERRSDRTVFRPREPTPDFTARCAP